MRPLTQTTEDIVDLARRIENRGRLKIDVIINNTNLADMTEPDMLLAADSMIREAAEELQVSRIITSGMAHVLEAAKLTDAWPMRRYMQPEWMEEL